MKKMKKGMISAILMGSLVCAMLAGCGNNASSGSNSAAETTAATESAVDAAADSSSDASESTTTASGDYDLSNIQKPSGDAIDWTNSDMAELAKAEAEKGDEAPEITYTGKTITLQLSHGNSDEDAQGMTANYFAERLEELTGGKIDVTIYANGTICSSADLMPTIQSGGIDGGFTVASSAESVNTLEGIALIPFMIYADDIPTMRELSYRVNTDPLIEKLLKEEAEKAGFVRLCDPQNSCGGLLFENNKRPVTTLAEAKGLKIRTTGGTNLERMMNTFGCTSVIISGSELSMALSQGVCDGVASSIDFIDGIGATCKYITMPLIYDFPNPLYVSANWYNSLPDDLKAAVEMASDDAVKFIYAYAEMNTDRMIEKVQADGSEIDYLNLEDADTMQAASSLLSAGIEDKLSTGGDAAKQIIDRIMEIKEEMGITTIEY